MIRIVFLLSTLLPINEMNHKLAFEIWYSHIDQWEGSKLSDPPEQVDTDKVLTKHGIRQTTFNHFAPTLLPDLPESEYHDTFWEMSREVHRTFARHFWNESGAPYVKNGKIAALMAEAYWGGGSWALKNLQRAWNSKYATKDNKLTVDGFPRKLTAAAFDSVNQEELYELLIDAMEARYKRIVAKDENKAKYLTGWLKRLYSGYPPKQLGFWLRFFDVVCPTCGK